MHPDVRRALGAVSGETVVGGSGTEDIVRVAVADVLRGRVQVVALEIGEQHVPALPVALAGLGTVVRSGAVRSGAGHRSGAARRFGKVHPEATSRATDTTARTFVSYPGRPCEQLGLGFVQLGLHVLWLLSRAVA